MALSNETYCGFCVKVLLKCVSDKISCVFDFSFLAKKIIG